ncbi:hypothetical protein GCM10018791_49100 [Streptomyces zaomyceticus]|nr:hypothetical protein GCM10018791_49100 [Streptomyces zaomyceticus]
MERGRPEGGRPEPGREPEVGDGGADAPLGGAEPGGDPVHPGVEGAVLPRVQARERAVCPACLRRGGAQGEESAHRSALDKIHPTFPLVPCRSFPTTVAAPDSSPICYLKAALHPFRPAMAYT